MTTVLVDVTKVIARTVEKETKVQHKTKPWYNYRAGNVIAFRMTTVYCTNVANPSRSLIKTIFFPDAIAFTNQAKER